ncbi:hypothetical protein [Salinibaculum rarum]|uniref:hypothetical protein n=1 Tax=Salinibaculum rarum TaxID=3058903 RepID=UPI00265F5851|nr:hypothetical protein [Salinibaculum sp. KK48]
MNRTRLLLVGVLVSAALLVPTGAFSSSGTDQVDDADLEMSPSDGPNGKYAVLNSDDEIELLLTGRNPDVEGEGLNDGTVTPIHDVFTITYTGDEYARVWLTDDATDVRFYRSDAPDESLEGKKNMTVLGPDETISVGLLVDTRGDDDVESASKFTVNAEVGTPTAEQQGVSSYDADDDWDGEPLEPDTPTPTPTETETPSTDSETTDSTGIQASENPETESEASASDGGPTQNNESGGATELGGFDPMVLALIVAALLLSVAGIRLYRTLE